MKINGFVIYLEYEMNSVELFMLGISRQGLQNFVLQLNRSSQSIDKKYN